MSPTQSDAELAYLRDQITRVDRVQVESSEALARLRTDPKRAEPSILAIFLTSMLGGAGIFLTGFMLVWLSR